MNDVVCNVPVKHILIEGTHFDCVYLLQPWTPSAHLPCVAQSGESAVPRHICGSQNRQNKKKIAKFKILKPKLQRNIKDYAGIRKLSAGCWKQEVDKNLLQQNNKVFS